jgi:preprotein translocase subunit SecA
VQLIGAIVLHQGKIAEMKTGEGKTLTATFPLYLNSLTGKGSHLVTVNDYLARRGCYWMGPVYQALDIRVASIYPQQTPDEHTPSRLYDPAYDSGKENDPWRHFRPIARREAYEADITYGTTSDFGFDYLRDNMVVDLTKCVQRPQNYAIVDEVDNLLIDEARTPLIISGPAEEAGQLYSAVNSVVGTMKSKVFAHEPVTPEERDEEESLEGEFDYFAYEKNHTVKDTPRGQEKLARYFKMEVDDIFGGWGGEEHKDLSPEDIKLRNDIASIFRKSMLAHAWYMRDRNYVVKDGEVLIVDEFTGRIMYGRRYSDGLHQAIEAKERVKIKRESMTYASITIQNYFRMYKKLAGMTGTALTEAEEFYKIYKLDVVGIRTNRPLARADYSDRIYKNEQAKFRAVVNEVEELYRKQQPVLIGTVSIEKSEMLSGMLKRKGIKHQVLNAKMHEKEADIIKNAGRLGAVTVATNMAGRGVDIILGGDIDIKSFEDVTNFIFNKTQELLSPVLGTDEVKRFIVKHRDAYSKLEKEGNVLLGELYAKIEEINVTSKEDILRELHREKELLQKNLLGVYQQQENSLKLLLKDIDEIQSIEVDKTLFFDKVNTFKEWLDEHIKVIDSGGLFVIGTERHEARRIDNQLRGRAGRQGDPGASRFYVSLEDDVMTRFGGDRIKSVMQWAGIAEDTPIENRLINRSIESAQVRVEGFHFDVRKNLVEYDDVVNQQRELFYSERRKILSGADLSPTSFRW